MAFGSPKYNEPNFPPLNNCFAPTQQTRQALLDYNTSAVIGGKSPNMKRFFDKFVRGGMLWFVRSSCCYSREFFRPNLETKSLEQTRGCLCLTTFSVYPIQGIQDVLKGMNTRVFQQVKDKYGERKTVGGPKFLPKYCFSIILKKTKNSDDEERSLDFVAPNIEKRDFWVRGLGLWVASQKIADARKTFDDRLKEKYLSSEDLLQENGEMDLNGYMELVKSMGVDLEDYQLREVFEIHSAASGGIIYEEGFIRIYYKLNTRTDILDVIKLFLRYEDFHVFGPEELCDFRQMIQNEDDATDENSMQLIKHYEGENANFLSPKGFVKYMLSIHADIMKMAHKTVYQDMTQPLNHYYIITSHNTGAYQGQLYGGEISIHGYVTALKKGCRCLDMDIHDGPTDDPVVFSHSTAGVTKMPFIDIIKIIKKYAFRASEYPLILSLRNHCSSKQQIKAARYIKEILGDYLCTDLKLGGDSDILPSPQSLMRKIIIEGRKVKTRGGRLGGFAAGLLPEMQVIADLAEGSPADDQNLAKVPLAKEFSDLVNYCQRKHFESFEDVRKEWTRYDLAEFVESKAIRLINEQPLEMIELCTKHLTHIFPDTAQDKTSNYMPTAMWNVGCQMVALNYQSLSLRTILNDGKFSDNGKCGYILKPEFLRRSTKEFDPMNYPENGENVKVLSLKIISGNEFPRNFALRDQKTTIDPFVVINVFGHHADEKKQKTTVIYNNGFCPEWNESFEFPVFMPDLALLLLRVKDKIINGKSNLIGYFCLPFNSLGEGYRHVHLLDNYGQPYTRATLFVHIKITNKKVKGKKPEHQRESE